jgi:hypothetical protein
MLMIRNLKEENAHDSPNIFQIFFIEIFSNEKFFLLRKISEETPTIPVEEKMI